MDKLDVFADRLRGWLTEDQVEELVQLLRAEVSPLRSVEEVCGGKWVFFIPDYQRGYRWGRDQVWDFLEDVDTLQEGEVNCIQPLVVRMDADGVAGGAQSCVVIDGQQRLTTIYIIISILSDGASLFKMHYNRHAAEMASLLRLAWDEGNAEDKVDFYHMRLARDAVLQFVQDKDAAERALLLRKLLKQSFFIWHETTEDENSVFMRLNIGKIPLTDAELIRALLLNRSDVGQAESVSMEKLQVEIASEWDRMETMLRQPSFWGFLHPSRASEQEASRVTLLFRLLKDGGKVERAHYGLYQFYSEAIKGKGRRGVSLPGLLRHEWGRVRELFACFLDWYNDLELYHYVGCYMALVADGQEQKLRHLCELWRPELFSAAGACAGAELRRRELFLCGIREELLQLLRGNAVVRAAGVVEDAAEVLRLVFEKVSYDDEASKPLIKPVLLIHNVQTSMASWKKYSGSLLRADSFERFPFHLFHGTRWDIEHIDSQHEYVPSNGIQTQLLLAELYRLLLPYQKEESLLSLLRRLDEALSEGRFQEEAISVLISECKGALARQNKLHMGKHKLWNLTLLDMSTNREYKDSPFSYKRMIILARLRGERIQALVWSGEKKKLEVEFAPDTSAPMVPVCASQVFTKSYTPTPSDLVEWSAEDEAYYMRDMVMKTFDFFGLKGGKGVAEELKSMFNDLLS